MIRSKLARHTGLQRFKRLPQVRKEPRRPALWVGDSAPARDPEYLQLVRELPCCAIGLPGHSCMGVIVAHHAGLHAAGRKCSDYEAISLCSLAHTCLHDFKGPFFRFNRPMMRAWEDAAIAETQRVLGPSKQAKSVGWRRKRKGDVFWLAPGHLGHWERLAK